MIRHRASCAQRFAALAIGGLGCLLAACGTKAGGDSATMPPDSVATPLAAAVAESATPAPAAATVAVAAAASPAPPFSANWLRNATPWAGWLSPATPAAARSAAAFAGDPLAGWKQFVSQEGGFTVWLPNDPSPGFQTLPTAAGPVTLHTFIYQTDDSAFYVGYADYPAGLVDGANLKRALDGARDGAVAFVHGTLLSEQDVSMAGMPGRQVTIKASYSGLPQGIVITARFAMASARMYQLQAFSAGPPTAAESARSEAFFQSFTLTP